MLVTITSIALILSVAVPLAAVFKDGKKAREGPARRERDFLFLGRACGNGVCI